MTRALTAIGFAVLAAIGIFAFAAYWTETDERETTLEREKDIGDAIRDSNAAPSWRGILLGRE
jgi:hypothetical protein